LDVEFDGPLSLIRVFKIPVGGVIVLDIQTDIYSTWKTWMQESDNSKYLPALRTIGGDPTTGEKYVAPYFFLTKGWKIQPYEGDHQLNLIGNLFVDEPETYGSNIAIPTEVGYTVLINMSTTSDAIQLAVGGGILESDKQDIADLVEEQTGTPIKNKVNSLPTDPASESTVLDIQGAVETVRDDAELLRKIETGRWKIINNQLIIYDTDGVTPLKIFNLKNKEGQPNEENVYDRIPI